MGFSGRERLKIGVSIQRRLRTLRKKVGKFMTWISTTLVGIATIVLAVDAALKAIHSADIIRLLGA